jgi:hypothetical protein
MAFTGQALILGMFAAAEQGADTAFLSFFELVSDVRRTYIVLPEIRMSQTPSEPRSFTVVDEARTLSATDSTRALTPIA